MNFPNFHSEVIEHTGVGYHRIEKFKSDPLIAFIYYQYKPNEDYIEFLKEIGYGYFFGGSFNLYPLDNANISINNLDKELSKLGHYDLMAIGYDGTTSGCFCVSKNDVKDKKVYWISWEDGSRSILSYNFKEWIEAIPKEKFNSKIYKGYKDIRDITSILNVIKERAKISIEVIGYDFKLIKPPGQEKDILPRYNWVQLKIIKNDNIDIDGVTIKFFREGSTIGDNNIVYYTLNIKEIEVEKISVRDIYIFDPFNVPFTAIKSLYDPNIDLSSKMRVNFKEILNYL